MACAGLGRLGMARPRLAAADGLPEALRLSLPVSSDPGRGARGGAGVGSAARVRPGEGSEWVRAVRRGRRGAAVLVLMGAGLRRQRGAAAQA